MPMNSHSNWDAYPGKDEVKRRGRREMNQCESTFQTKHGDLLRCHLQAGHKGAHQSNDWQREYDRETAPDAARPLEFHKPDQIPVNTPMCDKCGKMFLECQCSSLPSGSEQPTRKER
jgi:hypothetical protein